ncbi:fas-associated death domain protein [Nylanderia fulva]|uniref:fas-associated death domain protein n=1 Tax=Nylanderia fulva TaxID=613905 RepID=UPI0010FB15AD|nr:fas-associated death domain protein [Nylanderia fulva]
MSLIFHVVRPFMLNGIMMLEKYRLLRQEFFKIAEPFIDSDILEKLKLHFARNIDSKRKLSKVTDLQILIRLLEKRNIISYDKIEPLRYISKRFIGDSSLENSLIDYENWLKTVPLLHVYNMYQNDEASLSSTISESTSNSNLSQYLSTVERAESLNQITQHCPGQEERNINKRKWLQQRVLLQLKDRLGRSWRDVARYLDIRECEIDVVEKKYPFDMKEQCYEILQIYISQSDTERWAINLIRALEKGRRRDLKELVEELVLKDKNI